MCNCGKTSTTNNNTYSSDNARRAVIYGNQAYSSNQKVTTYPRVNSSNETSQQARRNNLYN